MCQPQRPIFTNLVTGHVIEGLRFYKETEIETNMAAAKGAHDSNAKSNVFVNESEFTLVQENVKSSSTFG